MSIRRRELLSVKKEDVKYIDLGLPSGLLWGKYNIGATTEEIGMYFSYANVEGHYYGDGYSFSSANYDASPGAALPKTSAIPANATYDAAVAVLGVPWRMPSRAEYSELNSNCNHTWTTINGVSGMLFTSKISGYTDKSVFFPASGRWTNTSQLDTGTTGRYYYSDNYNATGVYSLLLTNNTVKLQDSNGRSLGMNIHPVCNIYYPGRQGAFVYDTSGKFYTADEWSAGIADGSLDNDDVVGVAVISGEHRFVMALSGTVKAMYYTRAECGLIPITSSSAAIQDFNGESNTSVMMQSYGSDDTYAAGYCYNTIFKNGKHGYLPSAGEMSIAYNYKTQITACLNVCGGSGLETEAANANGGYHHTSSYRGWNGSYIDEWGFRWRDAYCTENHISGGYLAVRPFCSID